MSRSDRLLASYHHTRLDVRIGHINIRWEKDGRIEEQLKRQRVYRCGCGPNEACSECP